MQVKSLEEVADGRNLEHGPSLEKFKICDAVDVHILASIVMDDLLGVDNLAWKSVSEVSHHIFWTALKACKQPDAFLGLRAPRCIREHACCAGWGGSRWPAVGALRKCRRVRRSHGCVG